MKKLLLKLLLGFGVFLILLPGFNSLADTAPELSIQVKDGKLTVLSEGAPLYGVLWAISAQADIRLNIIGEMMSEGAPVIEDFSDRPLADGFAYLLEQYLDLPSYTLVTNSETGELESAHVFADAFGDSLSPLPDDLTRPSDDSNAQPAEDWDMAEKDAAAIDPLDQALEAAWAATDPDEQVETLQTLGNYEDPRALEVIESALLSEQAKVRQAALEAIPWSAETTGVLADVHSLAVDDPEPAVRQTAVMILVYQDDTSLETRALLEALVEEEKLPNRDFFQQQLDRIRDEDAASQLSDTQGN